MNFRRIGIAGVLAVLALGAWAGQGSAPSTKAKFDVTGTWNATVSGATGPATTVVFVLKQDGDTLTGTVSIDGAAPVEISDARVLRTSIYFTVNQGTGSPPGQKGPPGGGMKGKVRKFTGTPSGNELKLTTQMQSPPGEGDDPTGVNTPKLNMVAKRQ